MASTPPPRANYRIHTPPTPMHGPRYDNYEPYSPRRSSRVAAKQHKHNPANDDSPSTSAHHKSTPSAASRASIRTSSQTFSPPSSPTSPSRRILAKTPQAKRYTKPRSLPNPTSGIDVQPESESDTGAPSTLLRPSVTSGMLPTPSKTPRKTSTHPAALASTSRILFPGRTATIEEAMPTPRQVRKTKRVTTFAIHGLGDDAANNIPIFTDSKERMPTIDDDEDNPFVTRTRDGKKKAPRKEPEKRKQPPPRDLETEAMEEAVRNNEGMIYVFRGRKIFRKFEDRASVASSARGSSADRDAESIDNSASPGTRVMNRRIGKAATRPLTRSSIKPRLLFQNQDQLDREAEEADEEAVTDIEMPHPKKAGSQGVGLGLHIQDGGDVEEEMVTPVKLNFRPVTPPTTVRNTRSTKKKDARDNDDLPVSPIPGLLAPESIPMPKSAGSEGSEPSPFASWIRKKTSAKAAPVKESKKRGGDELEREDAGGKRTRSGTYPKAPA
ncbi:hypothetical protein K402DRAFT_453936 [Aulographum hederae CBS 113979]|uniref:Uncharacterized protein n=1 Tax=Aulographum hederae CBS 113979 TaxID=1176131 RepID=A0A6G1H1I3_9PEZI|nr:hypothetical protein K402DRAFT_453936 [Aulographum hederae CBS 113979]